MLNSGLIGRKIRCSRTLGPWLRIVALTAVAIFLSTATAIPAQAQQQDARTKKARELFLKGVDAFDAGRYQDARGLFLQVWNLKKAPVVLLNLGQSELRAGLNEDGGNHLQQFLREHSTATPSQKATAEKGIETVKRRTGYVI
jgi:outer membrane protein assembly factor BamD (BamD/ComL family)